MPRTIRSGRYFAVVLGAGLIVVGLIWAVGEAREEARRSQCVGNCKWIVMNLLDYESEHGSFPPGTMPHPDLPPSRRLSWIAELWPTQHTGGELKVDASKGWDVPPNWPPKLVGSPGLTFFGGMTPDDLAHWVACPDDPAEQRKSRPLPLSYVGIAGLCDDAPSLPPGHPRAGVFGYDRVTRSQEITDGTSQTMIVVETARDLKPWTAGGPSSVRGVDPATKPYIGHGRPFGGYHRLGTNLAFADGSVRFVRKTISPKVFEAYSTIAGGEALPRHWGQ